MTVENCGGFLSWLRTGDGPEVASIERRRARFAESTISARLGAVLSCYDYHVLNGVDVGRAYDPSLGSIDRTKLRVATAEDAYLAAKDADAILLLTEWPEFAVLDWSRI